MSGPSPGDQLELRVDKPVYRGLGLARCDGQVVLVSRGLPGERLRVRVERRARGYLSASVVDVLEPSPDRRASPCRHFERCGGCAYQELDYAAQLRLKRAVLRESLARAGASWGGEVAVAGSPEQGWRTRATLHLDLRGPRARVGFLEPASHTLVDIERCPHLSEPMSRAARALAAALHRRPGVAGRFSGIALAESDDGSALVASLASRLGARELAALGGVAGEVPWLSGLGVELAGGRFVPLHGDLTVTATARGLVYRAHVRSFFQGNRFLLEPLVESVLEELPAEVPVLDLYAGVGLFGLAAAAAGAPAVRAVEIGREAVADAHANARRAGLSQVTIARADASQGLAGWRPRGEWAVVLDPPRAGLGRAVVEAVSSRRPGRIVYVSCDPPTLGRDLARFAKRGYRLQRLRALDLFPDTHHVESVATLVPG